MILIYDFEIMKIIQRKNSKINEDFPDVNVFLLSDPSEPVELVCIHVRM